MKPNYCTQNNGECAGCSLSSYGRDCQNNPISPDPEDVRAARNSAGLTQEQAAQVIGATRRAWQEWEAGRRNMPGAKWELFQIKTRGERSMYRCELIDDGVVIERFFRNGTSEQDVKEALEIFQWPNGEWVISREEKED